MDKISKLQQVLSLIACLLIIVSLAALKQTRIMGHDLRGATRSVVSVDSGTSALSADTVSGYVRTLADGSVVVNTTNIARDIKGYAGCVPLEITIKNGIITNIKALPNEESKPFFDKASALFGSWIGKNVDDAAQTKVDAVSGATFSSKAIIGNVQRGLQYASRTESTMPSGDDGEICKSAGNVVGIKDIAGLVVALMAAIVPLFLKSRKWRMAQTALNVIVLGFWCGTFLSYSSLIGFFANGFGGWAYMAFAVMLITAFVYPLFGKHSYYCTNVCPFGGLQQLTGSVSRFKVVLSPKTVRRLDVARQTLWALLMLFVWSGVWSSWIDYEPFTAFLLGNASWVAIVIAVVFVGLSFVVSRPYCRFVCPMGTLLKYSQKTS